MASIIYLTHFWPLMPNVAFTLECILVFVGDAVGGWIVYRHLTPQYFKHPAYGLGSVHGTLFIASVSLTFVIFGLESIS